ncbi:MAG: TolC family protein [Alloacidobacterium sp.]|jgi:outer membrane protein
MMKNAIFKKSLFACAVLQASVGGGTLLAQSAAARPLLPDAPPDNLIASSNMQSNAGNTQSDAGMPLASKGNDQPAGTQPRLTRTDAEQMAIKNNPRISIGHLLALAQHQVVRETRAAELPTGAASITAVEAEEGSRLSAGSLTASRLLEHAGAGGGFTQLITDFGKTSNLVASSKLQEKAQNARALATTEDIVLATDQAFYNALQAQALLKVAEQNVNTRQTTQSQVSELTTNKLKSTLDLSFADVNLSQGKLQLLDAQNNAASTMAALDAVLGLDRQVVYDLVDDSTSLQPPPPDADQLVQLGLQQRPDLQALNYSQQSAVKFSRAQRDQMFPTINAAGTAGVVPIRPDLYYVTNWWGAIGVNMNIPIFNGFLYSAQAKEASIRAQAASEESRDLRDQIVRDIRTSWLAANTAFQRVSVTAELLKQANLALALAQTRYQIGLSSIVELSQAQYQQTDAAIGNTNAQYQYRLALATLNYQIGATP